MSRRTLFLCIVLALTTVRVNAQTITVPNAPKFAEQIVSAHKVAIKTPAAWRSIAVGRNEILVRNGRLGEAESTCMVRLTTIAELRTVSPQAFVEAMTKVKFLEMTSIAGPKPEIHVFDTALLGGVVARRIIHTQPHDGIALTYLSHQALRGGDVFTVTCYAAQADFANVMGTFGMIIGSTRFLP